MPYSSKSNGVPLKELVSTTSQPASRKRLWTRSTASGRVTSRFSLQPSKRGPPKSSSDKCCACKLVPIAPSKTTTRSFNVSRKVLIGFVALNPSGRKEKPRAKQRGAYLSKPSVCGPLLRGAPSCLAVYFTWPQVALTHHV